MEKIKIICTIGPSSNNLEILSKLKDRGASFFRINLSHTNEKDIEKRIKELLPYNVPIILDTEGSQIRSGNSEEIEFREGSIIKIYKTKVKCNKNRIFFAPLDSITNFRNGDLIFIDFNSVLLKVGNISNIKKGFIECNVLIGGKVGGRKAVYVDSLTFKLPPFSKKDIKAIELAKKYGIKHFTLSFMESKQDVLEFKKMYPESNVFSKIESKRGLQNFLEIAEYSDGILIDRGDLSHQIPLERIPFTQKHIINECGKMNKDIFITTNTLEQMSVSLKPNRAEVNDIINTLIDGATGIALTKETAVGKYPVETLNMLSALINQFYFLGKPLSKEEVLDSLNVKNYIYSSKAPRLLISPHGGVLINRYAPNTDISDIKKRILLNEERLMDIEQIAIGAFSPLEGFMCRKDFYSVINHMRLKNNVIWPIPIVLPIDEDKLGGLRIGDKALLIYEEDNKSYGIIEIEDIYRIDKKSASKKIFGTEDISHPGVNYFTNQGNIFVGGKITLIKRRNSSYSIYELAPLQTRRIFTERGWSKVIAFHTRNVPHKSHEFIQQEGLKMSLSDGLFIHPVIGKKKQGDFSADAIIKAYEKLIETANYSRGKILLCSWGYYSRYAGPREALFTAIVRKNFGCSHFIVGRDHTGVKDFYSPTASHEIFNKFSKKEIGIIPIKFNNVFYSVSKKKYMHEKDFPSHPENDKFNISGTKAREILSRGKKLPKWFMRTEISEVILNKLKKKEEVFLK